jgi:hypothetical protein
MTVAAYDFPYATVATRAGDDDGAGHDLVVATSSPVHAADLSSLLADTCGRTEARVLFARSPVFWAHVRTTEARRRADVDGALRAAGIPVRYVASARRGCLDVPPPLDFACATGLHATDWAVAAAPALEGPVDRDTEGRWFLRGAPGGLAVDRSACGTGAGTRLAVIDDDGADLECVPLEATVPVGVDHAPRGSGHGALLIGWAVGARTHDGGTFHGVAPDASVRAYVIARPGDDVVSLPLAIARAAVDGADVIVCATYVEGTTSPMLDDALELATRLGRDGRGCVVVFPTGRETSSPRGSIHASLSLSLGDPASDPRVLCVGPGGRHGGWFFWRTQQGRLRPFANRGPAVRCLAPGDDIAYPFLSSERVFHADSSGASALAAGVALLVLANNRSLTADEVLTVLARTATSAPALSPEVAGNLVDKADALPLGRDRDGHDAKHGYGHLHAARACLSAADPVCLELIAMGEDAAALAWFHAFRRGDGASRAYPAAVAEVCVRALLADDALAHALRVVLRHVRLLASDPRRMQAHVAGGLSRQVALLIRRLADVAGRRTDAPRVALEALAAAARAAAQGPFEGEPHWLSMARAAFPATLVGAPGHGTSSTNPSP